MRNLILICLIAGYVFTACDKELKIIPKVYPYVVTESPNEITQTSITFNAAILDIGQLEVLEYGFIWDFVDPTIDTANKVIVGNIITAGSFSKVVDYKLFNGMSQYVRAYVKTKKIIVYGESMVFNSYGGVSPVINEITPLSGYVGTHVYIKGKNFGVEREGIKVLFGEYEAVIEAVYDNCIVAIAPDVAFDIETQIVVSVYGKAEISRQQFKVFTYWKRIADFPNGARQMAVAFVINGKGYVGTGKLDNKYFSDLWEYSPETDSWKKMADFPGEARSHAIGFEMNGKGYIGFGTGTNGSYHDLWEYDPETNLWTFKNDNPMITTYADICFVMGNHAEFHTQIGPFVYNPIDNLYAPAGHFPGEHRYYTMGITCNGKGYILPGWSPGPTIVNDFWEKDPSTNGWTKKSILPNLGRPGMAAFSLDSLIYAGLGNGMRDFYVYNPKIDTWKRIQNFGGSNRWKGVSFAIGNKAYIGLGEESFNNSVKDFWEFDPNKK